jgi:hypothetical protein
MFRVRCICLPIPVISWDVIISPWRAILLPTFITIPEFVPLSVENTLHVPYSLLAKLKSTRSQNTEGVNKESDLNALFEKLI